MKMKIDTTSLGHYLVAEMKANDFFYTEPGSIISSTGEIDISSEMQGGLMGGAMRMIGGGESLFINKITAKVDCTVELGTTVPSEMMAIDLDGSLLLGDGAYVAHTGDIKIGAKWGGFESFSVGSGLMFLYAKGKGMLYIAGFESMFTKELKANEIFYLDNSCFVGVTEGVSIEKFLAGRNLLTKVVGGEGIMLKITGPGKVFYSTQSLNGLASSLVKYLPKG
ncbi:MAG: TIGR00266 family protein [Candidatus Micrarchaeota archaeon]|nr:TIGR00266 family protein [Candidatus Micrarchaeota archaeon]